jgi:hypothetical protein
MKTQVVVDFYHASAGFAYPLEAQTNEDNKNGNRNSPPVSYLHTRPMAVLAGWIPASYKHSGLPSSLKDWLASKDALVIG